MHPWFIVGALLHATVLAVVGFFVLFAASKAAGLVRTIGNVLGVWLFILAVLALVAAAFAPSLGAAGWHSRMMGSGRPGWMQPGRPVVSQPSNSATGSAPGAAGK